MSNKLPQELIEDFKSNVKIKDLCRKYELTYRAVKDQLMELGLTNAPVWGGYRKGCGRRKIERNSEIKRIREYKQKIPFAKQPEGTKANPRSNLCRKYTNDYYQGGF